MENRETPPPIHQCECRVCQDGQDEQVQAHHRQINLLLSRLTEPQRRWYAGVLAQQPGGPSERELARITGLARNTIRRGRQELDAGLSASPVARQRQAGGGRPKAEKRILTS
jgi:hypothetical protein